MKNLKTISSLCAFTALTLASSAAFAQDLMITKVFDGPRTGGVPKGVELTVLNDIADLSTYGIGSANNGGGTDGEEFTFPADSVSAGDKIYVATEDTEFQAFFGFAPTYITGVMAINGDDAIELFFGGSIIDVFGESAVDGSGTAWEYTDGWAVRYAEVQAPSASFDAAQWVFSGRDALDGASDNATAENPIPTERPSMDGGNNGGPAPVAGFPLLLVGFGGLIGLGMRRGRKA